MKIKITQTITIYDLTTITIHIFAGVQSRVRYDMQYQIIFARNYRIMLNCFTKFR